MSNQLTEREEEILRHTTGSDSRYRKKEWGFRNYFCAGPADLPLLDELTEKGYLNRQQNAGESVYFFATVKALEELGFSKTRINKTENTGRISILHLNLTKKWFDMILSGEKREEYREWKEYWHTRLRNRKYDIVRFRNGYQKDAPTFDIELLEICFGNGGNPEWGAKPMTHKWILKLGKVITNDN